MTFIIDGYNLLHAMGMLCGPAGPAGLEKARLQLLELLHRTFGGNSATVTVVFDAARSPPGATDRQDYHGLDVRYAVDHTEADDLIEDLIRQSSAPRQLNVVSDDHRIQNAARRRRCQALTCDAFLDWLDKQHQKQGPQPPTQSERPPGPSGQETKHWLKEFADLENNPEMKELFNPFDFT